MGSGDIKLAKFIEIHSVKQRLLRNGPESGAIPCAKDYEGHSFVQTSLTELPSRVQSFMKSGI